MAQNRVMKYFVVTESKVNKFRVHRLNTEIIVFKNCIKSLLEMRQKRQYGLMKSLIFNAT